MGIYKERKIRQNKSKRKIELFGISLTVSSILLFVLVCLPLGRFSGFFLGVFGVGVYPLLFLLALFGIGVYLSQRYYLQKRYFVYLVLNFVFLICLLHTAIASKLLNDVTIDEFGNYLVDCYYRNPLSAGGVLVAIIIFPLVCLMGVVGTCITFAILLCIFIGLAVDFLFFKKNKLSRKDHERNRRFIENNIDSDVNISSLARDYDTSATKLVPKKFEKEDNERYIGLQNKSKGAAYFSNRLQGFKNDVVDDSNLPNQNDILKNNIDNSLITNESNQDENLSSHINDASLNNENIRLRAKNLLFGNKEEIYKDQLQANSKVDDEIYPSKYDPNLFMSKKEYITTPILPGYLNKKNIDRKYSFNANDRSTHSNIKEKNNENIGNKSDTNILIKRNTDFLNATERSNAQLNSADSTDIINNYMNHESADELNNNSFESKRRFHVDRADANIIINKSDDIDDFLPKQTFSPEKLNDPLLKRNIDNVLENPVDNINRNITNFNNASLDLSLTDDQSSIDANRPITNNIKKYKNSIQSRSDLVDDESFSVSEQKRLGTNVSVVAPAPKFLDKVEQRQVQSSLLGDRRPSFNKAIPNSDSRYVAPNPNLLTTKSDDPSKYGGDIQEKSRILEETLESFRINAKVSNVVRGPSVTRYELQIPAGIPVRKISNYESNIAMTLMSKNGIRLELPIPGKNAVGVEIPNDTPCTVGLKDMVLSPEFQSASGVLPVAIGKNISGEYVVRSMAKMVHLLVAGSTGSGKSVFLHNLILSLMFKSSPDQLRFIMIDPKRVEFIVYNGMPHMMLPNVVTECDKAINALSWATKEMDRRYRMFNQHLVNDIESFNKCSEVVSGEEKKIPYIVIVIDELADLMMIGQKEVERHIQRIAQLGRACGIHLVIATQRPTVQVVTGTIKANLPTRVAFSLTSVIDSKTILDEGGAEKLIGKGDMLFSPQGASQPIRLQAAFASLDEVKAIVNFLKENNSSYFDEDVEKEIMAEPEASNSNDDINASAGADSVDEFFYPALRLFIETGTASTTMIQRRFGVGYARAARLVDQMEVKGYISPQNGSKKRNVYLTMEQYRELSGDED